MTCVRAPPSSNLSSGCHGERVRAPRPPPSPREDPAPHLAGSRGICGSASRRTTIRLVEIPEVRYAKTPDGTHIAFQVFGHGPRDLVYVPGFISNVLLNWELPGMAHILDRLARFARVVVIDHRGTGLSDPVAERPWEFRFCPLAR
jgi:hypothetical protein